MLPIVTTLNSARFERDVQQTGKQAVFALAVAINKTLEQKQAQLRAHVASRLSIRNGQAKKTFGDVFRFGTAQRADAKRLPLSGRIDVVGGSVGATASLFRRIGAIVIRQEEGGTFTSNALYRTQRNEFAPQGFTIPAPGLRTSTRQMPKSLYPSSLGLSGAALRRRDLTGLGSQYKGGRKKKGGFKKGTKYYFVKPGVGIFMREPKAQASAGSSKAIRMFTASRGTMDKGSEYDSVWFFRRRINLPRRLRIAETFSNGLEARLAQNYAVAFADAIRTAR